MKRGLVLVTGSGGFNGRVVLQELVKLGYNVRATDLESGERTSPREFYDSLGVEFAPSDLTDPSTLPPVLKGVKYILHTASLFDYSATLEENNRVNVDGGRNLLDAAIEAGAKKIVLWGTIGVYGSQEILPVTEENPPNPSNAYEISKMAQEELFLEYAKEGKIKVAVMRPSPVYGAGNRYGFINIMKLCTFTPQVPVPEKFDCRLPSVHVKDVARAGIFLMEAPDGKVNGEIFNVLDDSNIHIAEFLYFIAGVLGKPTLPIKFPLHKGILIEIGHITAKISGLSSQYITHKRPVIEDATVGYMKYDYKFSNQKIKDLGFKFDYPDCRVGLIEMIDWIKEENMEPLKLFA